MPIFWRPPVRQKSGIVASIHLDDDAVAPHGALELVNPEENS